MSTSRRDAASTPGRSDGPLSLARRAAGRVKRRVLGGAPVIPRRTIGSREYASLTGAVWREVEPALPIERRPPVRYGKLPGDFDRRVATRFPEMGVLELPEGMLVSRRGWVVTRDGYLLPDHSLLAGSKELPVGGAEMRVHRLPGVVASLVSDHAWWNYGHFLYDGLGRFELLRRAGCTIEGIDRFVCAYPGRKARRLLERLGIPDSKIVPVETGRTIQADLLLAPTFPGSRRDHPRWLIDFLRRELVPVGSAEGPLRRLYAQRSKTRRVANEQEILPILASYGFETFDPDEHDEPLAAFARAEAVVGVHGANLADICFCPEGAKILELTPTDHISSYWWAQAEMAGLDHAYIVCQSTGERSSERARKADVDVRVDPDDLRQGLAAQLGRPG
ncbi:MAG: glycosyltransferase family 61 protein [Candidatus Limnocylindrales bacterium]